MDKFYKVGAQNDSNTFSVPTFPTKLYGSEPTGTQTEALRDALLLQPSTVLLPEELPLLLLDT